MKKFIFLVAAAAMSLSACRPTPTPTPSPSPMLSPSPSQTRALSETPDTLLESKTTHYPSSTPLPTPSPTPAPTPTLFIQPPQEDASYHLVQPDLDFLVRQYFTDYQAREITSFLASYYHPEGGLPYQNMLEYVDQADRIPYFDPYFRELLTQALRKYVLENQQDLDHIPIDQSDAFQFSTQQVELDGDPGPELLIRVVVPNLYYQGWLAFNTDETGELIPINSPEPQALSGPLPEPINPTYLDFDGDGVDDLLFMEEYYLGGGGNSGLINIYRGSSKGYSLEYKFSYFYTSKGGDGYWYFTLEETDPPSIVIINENSINWDCEWTHTITVAWKNGKFRETHAGEDAPNTPECLIAQSVHQMDYFPESGFRNLNVAIQRIKGNPAYHPDLETFARLRLALLNTIDGNLSAVRKQLEAIQTLSENPEAEGAQFITEQLPDILREDQVKIHQLCSKISHTIQAEDPISTFWEQYLWADSFLDKYNPRILCPSFTFMPTFFAALPSPESPSFEATLKNFGITTLALESYTTKEGKILWAGVFDAGAIFISVYQLNKEGVDEWDLLNWHTNLPTDDWQWFIEDFNEDGYNEIALSFSDPYWARGAEKYFRIYLATFNGERIITDSEHANQESLDLRRYIADSYGQNISASIREKEISSCRENFGEPNSWFLFDEKILDYLWGDCNNDMIVYGLEIKALENNFDAESRTILEHARTLVDLEDDYGPEAWQNLTYLIALSHELEGNTCEAVAGYLAVWESQPVTSWNLLAASHLEAVDPSAAAPACSPQ